MIYVLDSSAFIFGFSIIPSIMAYTTEEVIREVEKNKLIRIKIDVYISQGTIKVISPPKEYISRTSFVAMKTADLYVLSKADISIIALALYLKESMDDEPILISDDYSIQNAASVLGIKFKSLTLKGIAKKINWIIYCPACGKTFSRSVGSVCSICGHKLKRKPKDESPFL